MNATATTTSAKPNTTEWALCDANGNLSEYLAASDSSVAAHYEYDPFGGTTLASGAHAADFAHRFSTKFLDAETGLYYYGYRFYHPEVGRWVSRDPATETGCPGLYCFVRNGSPCAFDPNGLWTVSLLLGPALLSNGNIDYNFMLYYQHPNLPQGSRQTWLLNKSYGYFLWEYRGKCKQTAYPTSYVRDVLDYQGEPPPVTSVDKNKLWNLGELQKTICYYKMTTVKLKGFNPNAVTAPVGSNVPISHASFQAMGAAIQPPFDLRTVVYEWQDPGKCCSCKLAGGRREKLAVTGIGAWQCSF